METLCTMGLLCVVKTQFFAYPEYAILYWDTTMSYFPVTADLLGQLTRDAVSTSCWTTSTLQWEQNTTIDHHTCNKKSDCTLLRFQRNPTAPQNTVWNPHSKGSTVQCAFWQLSKLLRFSTGFFYFAARIGGRNTASGSSSLYAWAQGMPFNLHFSWVEYWHVFILSRCQVQDDFTEALALSKESLSGSSIVNSPWGFSSIFLFKKC